MFTARSFMKNGSKDNAHKNGNGNGNGHGVKIESVLGPGIHYQGTLTGSGGVRVEGAFDGTITLKGPLVIAEGAKINAEIQASAVSVAGSVKGNITATKVEILSTGKVWGDLITVGFVTEEGSFLRGEIKMQEEEPMPPALEVTQPHTVEA